MFVRFFLLLGISFSLAQTISIGGIILEEKEERTVPYVEIYSVKQKKMFFSDEHGKFLIETDKQDTLFFRHILYKDFCLPVSEFSETEKIYLKRDTIILSEILITGFVKGNVFKEGFFKKKYLGFLAGPASKIAFYIKNPKKQTAWIQNVLVYIGNKGKYPCNLKINLIGLSEGEIYPGKSFLGKPKSFPIIKKGQKIKWNVSEENILFPKKGIIVELEWDCADKKHDGKSYFELQGNISKEAPFLWSYNGRVWKQMPKWKSKKGFYLVPRVGLEVIYSN